MIRLDPREVRKSLDSAILAKKGWSATDLSASDAPSKHIFE
jgi:hypothetical protein